MTNVLNTDAMYADIYNHLESQLASYEASAKVETYFDFLPSADKFLNALTHLKAQVWNGGWNQWCFNGYAKDHLAVLGTLPNFLGGRKDKHAEVLRLLFQGFNCAAGWVALNERTPWPDDALSSKIESYEEALDVLDDKLYDKEAELDALISSIWDMRKEALS